MQKSIGVPPGNHMKQSEKHKTDERIQYFSSNILFSIMISFEDQSPVIQFFIKSGSDLLQEYFTEKDSRRYSCEGLKARSNTNEIIDKVQQKTYA